MDTPDKAASLADSAVADAVNKDWLVESARSSQLSTELRLRNLERLEESGGARFTRSAGQYGSVKSCRPTNSAAAAAGCGESSWLRRHYFAPRKASGYQNSCGHNYSINGHLYDNISFADSPLLRSLSGQKNCNEEENASEDSDATKSSCCFGKFRYFLACYVLLGITLAIYSRNALSLAAVGMIANNVVNKELVELISSEPPSATTTKALDGSCPVESKLANGSFAPFGLGQNSFAPMDRPPPPQTFAAANKSLLELKFNNSIRQRIEQGELVDWTPSEQGLIFAAGSVGNLLIAIPITRLGEIYGPKWIIFAASLGATLQAALMPLISPCHVVLVLIFQVIFNGLTFGADCVAYTLFAYWLTPTEMAFFVSCLLICYQVGTIISSFVTARLLSQGLAWSWCFYTPAILCGIWTLVWALIGSSEPSQSKLISRKELLFLLKRSKISQSCKKTTCANTQEEDFDETQENDDEQLQVDKSISWTKLAKDPNIWAIIAVKFTLRWYFSVYLSLMPTYLSSVAHMSVSAIGQMSVFQSFVCLFAGVLMGYLTKSLVTKRPFDVSLATTRKVFQSIVNFGLALSLIVFILYDCNQLVTIITLTFGGVCINFYVAAALQLPLDLSPKHCGLITSITNTLALGQALGAPISGLILNGGPKDRVRWQLVWTIAIVMNTLSGLVFILLVDSKPRNYNISKEQDGDDEARQEHQ